MPRFGTFGMSRVGGRIGRTLGRRFTRRVSRSVRRRVGRARPVRKSRAHQVKRTSLQAAKRAEFEKATVEQLQDVFNSIRKTLQDALLPDGNIAKIPKTVWSIMRKRVVDVIAAHDANIFQTVANDNGMARGPALAAGEHFAQKVARPTAGKIVDSTRKRLYEMISRRLSEQESEAEKRRRKQRELLNILLILFGPKRSATIVRTETTRAETAAVRALSRKLVGVRDRMQQSFRANVGVAGVLGGAGPGFSAIDMAEAFADEDMERLPKGTERGNAEPFEIGNLPKPEKRKAPADLATTKQVRPRVTRKAEPGVDTVKKGEETIGKRFAFKLVWRLDPNCNHCSFCPLVEGTTEAVWGKYVEGPPAHPNCCCSLELVHEDYPTRRPPLDAEIVAAMKSSNVGGFV